LKASSPEGSLSTREGRETFNATRLEAFGLSAKKTEGRRPAAFQFRVAIFSRAAL
jgi:hypothetical protein